MKASQGTLGVCVTVEHVDRYEITHVTILSGKIATLADRLEGAIDNKAGYGTPEAAERVYHETRDAIEDDYTHWFDDCTWGQCVRVRISYQRTNDGTGFCEPSVESVGYRVEMAIEGARLLASLQERSNGWKRFPESPEALLKRLAKRAVRIERWGHEYLVAKGEKLPKAVKLSA